MSIIEINSGPVTHRYLMNKTKHDLASYYMDLLRLHESLQAQLAEQQRECERLRRDNVLMFNALYEIEQGDYEFGAAEHIASAAINARKNRGGR